MTKFGSTNHAVKKPQTTISCQNTTESSAETTNGSGRHSHHENGTK